MFNCDESAVQSNKSGKRIIIPRKYKCAHSVLNGTTRHITALCCVSASGVVLPPLMVFAKGLLTGHHFLKTGPINATYASSESGFVNQDIYLEWFNKTFPRYAPAGRPLLLLQDGASAHLGVDLIDAAIKNDVILLCFPPKMTNLLQPCDVSLYRVMKSHIRACMQKVKMIRGELWVGKQNFPGIFNEVFLNVSTWSHYWCFPSMWYISIEQRCYHGTHEETRIRPVLWEFITWETHWHQPRQQQLWWGAWRIHWASNWGV